MYVIILPKNWKISKNMSSKNYKNITRLCSFGLLAAVFVGLVCSAKVSAAAGDCIILQSYCDENGMANLFNDALEVLKGAVYVAGGIGVTICGVIWATALDNDGRVAKAKTRLSEIVIGVAVFAMFDLIMQVFIHE